MPTTTQLAMTRLNVSDARCLALFASGLQPSDAPTAETVAQAIHRAIRQLGVLVCLAGRGCRCGLPDLGADCLVPGPEGPMSAIACQMRPRQAWFPARPGTPRGPGPDR